MPKGISLPILIAMSTSYAGSPGDDFVHFEDPAAWESAVGHFATIDFTCCGVVTITDEYAELGATFTDGNDVVVGPGRTTFPNDEWGVKGIDSTVTIEFSSHQRWIAADFPGLLVIQLYLDNVLIDEPVSFGSTGYGQFGGVVAPMPFDKVELFRWVGQPWIDDVHFGGPEPADVNADGTVNVHDLVEVILNWGVCAEAYCTGDIDIDGIVDTSDLITVILSWD